MKSNTTITTSFNTRTLKYFGIIILISGLALTACNSSKKATPKERTTEVIYSKEGISGIPIEIEFIRGSAHNHPLMAFWIEDTDGNYLETIYVAESVGTGIFGHGQVKNGTWEPGPVNRPAALPYWWHKWGNLPNQDKPVPDAITGPTPQSDFVLRSNADASSPQTFRVVMEINQSWDWNEYWSNDKYPDNRDYKTSSQPALVYTALVDPSVADTVYFMEIAGHSHYAGQNGLLFEDISSLTTAKNIAGVIRVRTGKNVQ
jgi:hypothetical protein